MENNENDNEDRLPPSFSFWFSSAEARRREDALAAEARAMAERERDKGVLVRLKSLQPEHSRSIGAEHLCNQILRKLGLGEILNCREEVIGSLGGGKRARDV